VSRRLIPWWDENPFPSVTYYRLRQTDFDGKSKLSHTISIVTTLEAQGLFTDLFPNPTNGEFYFNYAGKNFNDPISVSIMSYQGQLVKDVVIDSFSKHQSISIQTDGLSNGVYSVMIRQGDKMEFRKISIIR
jgi:hypothetical protein